MAPKSIVQIQNSLRGWWRLFDVIELRLSEGGATFVRLDSVAQLTEIHRQKAHDDCMGRIAFGNFVRIANLARYSLGLPKLHWHAPEAPESIRYLPPKWQTDLVRFSLKRTWFATLHRWEQAEGLLAGRQPQSEEEARLLRNYLLFQSTVEETGHPRPSATHLWQANPRGKSNVTFGKHGYAVRDMLRGFYPDSDTVRSAFHLCLANTGWNPSVLLALDVNKEIIEPHPKDAARYMMIGHKARGDSIQTVEGLYKSQGSPGMILQMLILKTAPLREQLNKELVRRQEALKSAIFSGAATADLNSHRKEIVKLQQGICSPWLFVSPVDETITWLHQKNYFSGKSKVTGETFLQTVVATINESRPTAAKISGIKPSDFRDAFAAYAYQISGGSILYAMKALGHRQPTTTQAYLDNSLLNHKSNEMYRTFSTALWHEIRIHRRVDPTIIAKWSRDGNVTDEERERLSEYRALKRSRLGVGCKDPFSPPSRIAPEFQKDGVAMCPVQRCTLCFENAVIFPESLSGLCKRFAELNFIKSSISLIAFSESTFPEELENTELALKMFDFEKVSAQVAEWTIAIANGKHTVVDLEGL
jgi:hypothetical protein